MSQPHVTYPRFSVTQRIEHVLALGSFTLLALTGLPQKFSQTGLGQGLILLMGGIEVVRVVHRVAAILLMGEVIFHIIAVGYRVFVRRAPMSMLPTPKDLFDARDALLHNLGRRKEPAQAGRYNFAEKAEYWAFVWGTIVMVITGFALWNPIATTRWFAGDVIPAAKQAHGGEALLAVLAIILWHFYHVHIRSFNKSMFTGRMSEHEMLEEHPRELADIKAGLAHRSPPPAVIEQRRRRYLPAALILAAALLAGLYWFVTFEDTALATVDRSPGVQAFVPLTATPLPTPLPTPTPLALQPVWDDNLAVLFQDRCVDCHGGAGGLVLETYAQAAEGGRGGPLWVAGDPDNSLIVQKMGKPHPGKLVEWEMQVLRAWIDAGAPER